MNKNKIETNKDFVWLPTANQEMLLKAALINNQSAVNFWQDWTKHINPYQAQVAERRLFPLVYHNLQTLQFKDEFTDLLKKSHRDSFKKTVSLLQIAGKTTHLLKASGIRTILLKGISLAIQYYPSPASRPMSDIDLLIEPENVKSALKIFNQQGWQTTQNNFSLITEIIHSFPFSDADKNELDLHWRLMSGCWNSDKNEIFWESAISLKNQVTDSQALCATDQLFHVCCHGARYNDISPIRWVADALMILKSSNEINWQRILILGKTFRLNLPLFYTLQYLKENFNAEIPNDCIEMLENAPKSRLEKICFKNFSEPPQRWSIWRFAQEAAFQYSSLRSSTTLKPRSMVFVKYLQHFLTKEKIAKKLSLPVQ